MLFSSIIFLFSFLPLTLAVYYLIPARFTSARNITLLSASLIFYSWGEPIYVFLLIYSSFLNYFMGLQIGTHKGKGLHLKAQRDLIFTIVMNLFILCFFKYFGFLMDNINALLGTEIHYSALSLPIGISFYTFQALSYIIDVYRGKVLHQYSWLDFTLYISLFPQLIAGPIVKYKDIQDQLEKRSVDLNLFGEGAARFIFGLGKKTLLANNLGALYSYILNLGTGDITVLTYWIGIIAYTLQIYFDFSGYSDMAIGLGKMFGFRFPENFNYPYISKSITEFWRRWHISLSTWFRDYLYIPLGGNRVPVYRHIVNLLIVWYLTGLWHGASWNFVIWGMYYGIVLILEKYMYGSRLEKSPILFRHIYSIVIVVIGWVFFSIENISQANRYIGVMFGAGAYGFANITTLYILRTHLILIILSCLLATPLPMSMLRKVNREHKFIGIIVLFGIFTFSIAYLVFNSYNPFLYFRF